MKKSIVDPFLKILSPITLLDFSSKLSFDELSIFVNKMMESWGSLLCKSITLACMALLGIFQDQTNEFLDLVTKNYLCPLVADCQSNFQLHLNQRAAQIQLRKHQSWHSRFHQNMRRRPTVTQLQENRPKRDITGVENMLEMSQTPPLSGRHALVLCLVSNT